MTDAILKFTPSHEWVKPDNLQYAVGITDHAQALLGDIVYVELPAVGTTFQAGDSMAVIESVKAAADVYAPISGTITAINPVIQQNPGLINTDPYQAGWLVQLTATHPTELTALLDETDYQNSLSEH